MKSEKKARNDQNIQQVIEVLTAANYRADPIETDGALVRLRVAELGKGYMTRWALHVDVIKAMEVAHG